MSFNEVMNKQQKDAEKAQKAAAGYAEGVMESIEAAYPSQQFVDTVKGMAAQILAVLEANDLTVEEMNMVFAALAQKAKQNTKNSDPQLHAELVEMAMQFTRGMVSGMIVKKKLSTLKPVA